MPTVTRWFIRAGIFYFIAGVTLALIAERSGTEWPPIENWNIKVRLNYVLRKYSKLTPFLCNPEINTEYLFISQYLVYLKVYQFLEIQLLQQKGI